jgi:hypothetical protein
MTSQCQRSSPRTKVNPLQPLLIEPVHQKLQVDVRRRQLLTDITSDHLIDLERRSRLWSKCIDERETNISSSTTRSRSFSSPTGEKQRGLFASYLTGLSIVFLVGQLIEHWWCSIPIVVILFHNASGEGFAYQIFSTEQSSGQTCIDGNSDRFVMKRSSEEYAREHPSMISTASYVEQVLLQDH